MNSIYLGCLRSFKGLELDAWRRNHAPSCRYLAGESTCLLCVDSVRLRELMDLQPLRDCKAQRGVWDVCRKMESSSKPSRFLLCSSFKRKWLQFGVSSHSSHSGYCRMQAHGSSRQLCPHSPMHVTPSPPQGSQSHMSDAASCKNEISHLTHGTAPSHLCTKGKLGGSCSGVFSLPAKQL